MHQRQNRLERLVLCGVMAAVYFVLSHFLKIRIPPNLRITFASLPIILLAVLYGSKEACLTALLGEFLCQALSEYGLTPTTPIWLLPPAFRGALVAAGCALIRRNWKVERPWKKPIPYGAVLVVAAILTTLTNTGVTWLDSLIFHYYSFAYVFGDFFVRLIVGILTAVLMTFAGIPILNALYPMTHRGGKPQ